MQSFVHIGARLDLEAVERVQHRLRHLRGRRAVQVVQVSSGKSRKFAL
jgi:hypothetical protein